MANMNHDGSKKAPDKRTKSVVNVCLWFGGQILIMIGALYDKLAETACAPLVGTPE